ncbi:MAG: phosphoribosylaminoimidazolesuccinocarboxamide synthase [Gracilibacter sp. BRH_c7a]|nr:MAG: phosphoribosylaminoimidazolesuccinocarboxamide synthase [Gracilibacter sp. BRH_c7a]
MKKLSMLYEGKAKKIFDTDDKSYFWVEYKDDATAFNGLKKGTILNKGIINNKMSAMMFTYLQQNNVDTHFVEILNDREQIVKRLKMIPLEIVVRNIVAGSLAKRVGEDEGYKLTSPVLEFYFKNDDLGDPMVNETHAQAMGWATMEQLESMKQMALKVNELLTQVVAKAGIQLVDYKLEFGLSEGTVMLGDEISPDTCRFWDTETKEKLDKDRFRRDLGKVEEAYVEVYTRLKEVVENA